VAGIVVAFICVLFRLPADGQRDRPLLPVKAAADQVFIGEVIEKKLSDGDVIKLRLQDHHGLRSTLRFTGE
jgi:hypothetical protein